jgi:hypothetical protein
MKNILFTFFLFSLSLIFSCGSIYQRRFQHGYTFIKHKKSKAVVHEFSNQSEGKKNSSLIKNQIQSNWLMVSADTATNQSSNPHFQHQKKLASEPLQLNNKINNNLDTDTFYVRETTKKFHHKSAKLMARNAKYISLVSISFFCLPYSSFYLLALFALLPVLIFIFSFIGLVLAFIALSMAKKAKTLAAKNHEQLPSDANFAEQTAKFVIGLFFAALIVFAFLFVIFL